MNICSYDTIIGKIVLVATTEHITNLYLPKDTLPLNIIETETPLLVEAVQQINRYLAGDLKTFSLPINPSGTVFMKKVWEELCNIPYGKTATYKEIATKVGNEKAARAVGLANNRNPIPIIIPCHRVIGANGALIGFRSGLELKKSCLTLKGKNNVLF